MTTAGGTLSSTPALVVGEALMDVIVAVDAAERRVVGGSPANVAVGLARLGETVHMLTHIAADESGVAIVRHLRRSGVQVLPESFTASKTPEVLATLQPDGSAHYVFNVSWGLAQDVSLPEARLVHLGSYSALSPESSDVVDQVLERASGSGAVVTFDPNIRADLLGSHREVLDRFEAILERTTIVKLSDEDAAWLFPRQSAEHVVASLARRGPSLAAITLGSRGSILAAGVERIFQPARLAVVADSVGAGDSYMAALAQMALHVDLERLDPSLIRALGARAAAAASVTVGRDGADLPWSADMPETDLGDFVLDARR